MSEIIPVPIEDELKEAYVDYAMSVIVSRALPDVRDGLKPVHRRILYTMYEEGIFPDRAFKKSASTVGNVIARYHPHGDQAVYDAMVRMAQDFQMRYSLVQGHGNFGSVDGDSAAQMRYTEARLSPAAMAVLADLEKDTVDWRPNFDSSMQEPVVLPALFPNLLVNGAAGIAVGMATNIPPHNLGEVVDALVALLEKPELTVEQLMEYLPGPDFPTGALILGTDGIREAYLTGRGSITMRAVVEEEPLGRGDRRQLVVTELPYQVNKARLLERIAQAVKQKRIEGITDLRDESDRRGTRMVFELAAGAIPEVVKNQLFKHSDLQCNFGVNLLALVDGVPRLLDLKQALVEFLDHRREVVTRRTRFELDKAEKRAHIVEGLLGALDFLDDIIAIIRSSADGAEARARLMAFESVRHRTPEGDERPGFSEPQAQAILDMRLARLTGLERQKLAEEYRELLERIEYLRSLLESPRKLDGVLRTELLEVKERFGDPRRSRIVAGPVGDFRIEDLIAEEQMVVTLSHTGYIKRTPYAAYRSQRRAGRGVAGTALKEEDFLEHLFVTSTHHHLLFFTNTARVFRLKVHQIPEYGRSARGTPLVNLLEIGSDEQVEAVIPVRSFDQGGYIVTGTRRGLVKRTPLQDYANILSSGIRALVLREGDELVSVRLTPGGEELIMVSRKGMAIRFREEDARVMGRVAQGVRGMHLREGDEVVAMDSCAAGDELLVVTEFGYGKRTPLEQYPLQNRGGLGVITQQITEKTGEVVGARVVTEDHELMVSTAEGNLIRTPVAGISTIGRNTQGVMLIRLAPTDQVTALACIVPDVEEGEEAEPGVGGPEGGFFEGAPPQSEEES